MAFLISLRTDKEFDAVKAFIDSQAYGGFCVREVADQNEHWHWLLEVPVNAQKSSASNLQTFRMKLTRAVPVLKGNASYSATEVKDVDKYERYMCKGESEGTGPELAWRNSLKYTDEKMEELHEEFWETNKKLKKRKTGSMIDFVVDEAKRQGIDWKNREKLGEVYVREVIARAKPLNLFAVKNNINTVQCLLCPNDDALSLFGALV